MDDAVRIAFEAGLPYAGLRDHRPDERLLDAVPPGWSRERHVVPIALDGDRLTLAAARADADLSGLDPVFTITLVISPAGEIAATLERLPAPATPAQGRLAQRLGIPVVDLGEHRPDGTALAALDPALQRRLRCVPLALDDGMLYVAIAEALDAGQRTALRVAAEPREVRLLAADGAALDDLLGALHGARWAADARVARRPRLVPAARAGALGLAVIVALAVAVTPAAIILMGLVPLAVALTGLLAPPRPPAATGPLPRTTVLLALGDGVGATVHAATTLAALEHPRDELEVLLLVDGRDAAAHRAAQALAGDRDRDATHRVIATPPELPAGRAALLAYGLRFARGAHVAVLDPGDIPAPQLLRAASAALAHDPRLAAVQARIVPARRSVRATLWHRALAPGLARLRIPFPLSATAFVVRRDATLALGARRATTIPDAVAASR